MKLPEIHGKNKIRDARICQDFAKNVPLDEIAHRHGLSRSRIEQIVYNNREYVSIDKSWERTKQVRRVQRMIDKRNLSNPESKKDIAELEELYHKLIKEEKSLIDQSTNLNQTYVKFYRPEKYRREDMETPSRTADRSV